jgi:YegS/Rv2252/BmrU family lipid kinase
VSGRRKARMMIYSIVNFLSKNGCRTTVFATTCQGNAIELVQNHAASHDRIICCGGDGTLNEVFSGLASVNIKIPVGYIPTGTTNDLANALGLTSDAKRAMHLALHGEECNLDLGTFNHDKYFSYVASFGAFSNVAYETPQWLKNRLGRASYFFYGISEIAEIRSHRVRIEADETVIDGDFVYGSVSNSTVIGGLVKLPEDSIRLDDGKFEVMLIKTPKGPTDLHLIVQGLVNQEYNDDSVLFFTASNITLTFEGDVPWTVDGEYAGENSKVTIGNIKQGIRILVERDCS